VFVRPWNYKTAVDLSSDESESHRVFTQSDPKNFDMAVDVEKITSELTDCVMCGVP
jgi:hypothetical protein